MKKLLAILLTLFCVSYAYAGPPIAIQGPNAPVIPGGRLTTSSTLPVITAASGSVGTIYYLPYVTQKVPVYNGTGWTILDITSSGVNVVLYTSMTTAHVYDVYLLNVAGTPTLCYSDWGSTTSRSSSAAGGGGASGGGSANGTVTQLNGIWVNAAAIASSNCFSGSAGTTSYAIPINQGTLIGSFYANATGKTAMSLGQLSGSGGTSVIMGISNAYNRVPVTSTLVDTATAITSASASWATLGANDNISVLDTLGQGYCNWGAMVVAGNGTAAGDCGSFGVAVDGGGTGTPAHFATTCAPTGTLGDNYSTLAINDSYPPHVGVHTFYEEKQSATGTTTYMPTSTQNSFSVNCTY